MKQNLYKILMTGAFAIAVFLFFLLAYPFHICHQEQCQLFEFTLRYFVETLSVPGGLADWLARFLTQFFVSAGVGSMTISLLLAGIQVVTFLLCKVRTAMVYALSFVAPILLVLFFCDGDAMVSALTAILCSLIAAKRIVSISRSSLRKVSEMLCIIPLFFLLGSLSSIFVVAVILHERNIRAASAMICLWVSFPIASHIIWGYPYFRLFYGMNYYRFHENYSQFLWLAATALAIVISIGQVSRDSKKYLPGCITFAILMAVGVTGVIFSYDKAKEEYMKYDILSSRFLWNDILQAAKKDRPTMPYSIAAVNLAIVKTGNLPHMFDYFQNGTSGLLPEYVNDYLLAWTPSEAYFQLGMINDCQRHTFEAQELIPDAQKSARAYRRLAETNLLNGNYMVARKYLRTLTHTFYYSHWAKRMLKMIESGDAGKLNEGYEYLRSVRVKELDFLFNHNAMDAMLLQLVHENPSNHMALEYMLMWDLLSNNLENFMKICPFQAYKVVPKPFQEAYLLAISQDGKGIPEIPDFISRKTLDDFARYFDLQRNGIDAQLLEKQFGNTYWFYYFHHTEK